MKKFLKLTAFFFLFGLATHAQSPTASFVLSDTSIVEGSKIQFTDKSSGTIAEHLWLFPGAEPFDYWMSNDAPPAVMYATAGEYNATLQVTDINDLTARKTVKITVLKKKVAN